MGFVKQFGTVTLELRQGDICGMNVDAITNAANTYLWMGGGVAGAIKRRGGQEIEDEAVAKGPIRIGEAVATGAGRLPARYVIHAPVMGPDQVTDAEKVGKGTAAALAKAVQLGCKSIALPAFGTGVGRLPAEESARAMLDAIEAHTRAGTSLNRIEIVLYDDDTYKAFEKVFAAS